MKGRVVPAYSGGLDTSEAIGACRSQDCRYDFGPAPYETADTLDQSLAKGFSVLIGMPSRLASERDHRGGRSMG